MRAYVSWVSGLALLAAAACASAQTSLRFTGNAVPARDRVMIQIDPHVPADVGLDFTLEFWMKAIAAENPSGSNGTSQCTPGSSENWITGRIMFDRAIFNHDRHGDYGLAIFRNGNVATLAFGILKLLPNRQSAGLCGRLNVADGQWHHVAITRNGTSGLIRIYVDGQLDVQGTGPSGDVSYENGVPSQADPGIPLNVDNYLGIGAEKFDADGARYPSYRGLIDEVRLSRIVRYPENQDSFARPNAPFNPDASTAALYHFDEDPGTTIVDSAPGGASPGERWTNGGNAPSFDSDTPFGGGTPGQATVQFTTTADSVEEGAPSRAITVTRTGDATGTASVEIRPASDEGTATPEADYRLPANRMLSFPTGATTQSVSVTILEDAQPEPAETIRLELANVAGATLGAQSAIVLTVVDNDTAPAPPAPPPPAPASGGGGGQLGLATLLALLVEAARRRGPQSSA